MSKKRSAQTQGRPASRMFGRFTEPAEIFEHIETESTSDTDPYRSRIEYLMTTAIKAMPDPDTRQDLEAMRQLLHGHVFEEVARQTGFVLGFEYCRELLTGETQKGRAR